MSMLISNYIASVRGDFENVASLASAESATLIARLGATLAPTFTQRLLEALNDVVQEYNLTAPAPLALQVEGDENAAVRTAFDRSYDALKPEERRVFRLLGLVPGPDVDTAAVAALDGTGSSYGGPGADQTGRLLTRLVGRHLVIETAPGRYTLHDLLRLYARSLADAEDGPRETAAAMNTPTPIGRFT